MPAPDTQSRPHDLRPRRSLGQHFLKDPAYLDVMVEAAGISPEDRVLEIGPGTGVLTQVLADTGAQVTAVELDERMVAHLMQEFAGHPNVTIVQGDILNREPSVLVAPRPDERTDPLPTAQPNKQGVKTNYKIAANLPYYITSAILRHILEAECPPSMAALMVQKEVAERICAEPDNMSLLAVSVQFYAHPKLVTVVPATAFYPQPKVDSAIVFLSIFDEPVICDVSAKAYFSVVRAGFAQRRKQVANSLSARLGIPKQTVRDTLSAAGIDPKRRAETFTLEEWRTVCIALGRT